MRKRRETVLVRPGKNVTLYIPADTPPEVIRYLNRLKEEGDFSQGIIELLTEQIRRQPPESIPTAMEQQPDPLSALFATRAEAEFVVPDPVEEQIAEPYEDDIPTPVLRPSLTPEELFRQAGRNAGKLMLEAAADEDRD
ncbi:hypothetical protein [Paenibacillus koleovorans]|uniref:hypothetical protein n=1 Tax=Paenibacillus koleovorans TaxID=121608 RepID=UPI000FD900FD|nr:hypothetical protein [Paenibacillus koleovorans]